MATATKLAGTYVADPVHSSFAFSVRYQGVSLFEGSLDEVDALIAQPDVTTPLGLRDRALVELLYGE